MVDMATWRIGFIQWQGHADNINKALAMPTVPSAEKTASKKPEPSTTAIP